MNVDSRILISRIANTKERNDDATEAWFTLFARLDMVRREEMLGCVGSCTQRKWCGSRGSEVLSLLKQLQQRWPARCCRDFRKWRLVDLFSRCRTALMITRHVYRSCLQVEISSTAFHVRWKTSLCLSKLLLSWNVFLWKI